MTSGNRAPEGGWVMEVERQLLMSEGIDPAWPGFESVADGDDECETLDCEERAIGTVRWVDDVPYQARYCEDCATTVAGGFGVEVDRDDPSPSVADGASLMHGGYIPVWMSVEEAKHVAAFQTSLPETVEWDERTHDLVTSALEAERPRSFEQMESERRAAADG